MINPEGLQLPILPDSIIEETYEEAIKTPRLFVTQTVDALASTRPYLLHTYLSEGLDRASNTFNNHDILLYFRQLFFVPACFQKYYEQAGLEPLRISRANINSFYSERTNLSVEEKTERDQMIKTNAGNSNPLLISKIEALDDYNLREGLDQELNKNAWVKSVNSLELYRRQSLGYYTSTPDWDYSVRKAEPSSLPIVRSSVIDKVLLEFALNTLGDKGVFEGDEKDLITTLEQSAWAKIGLLDIRSYLATATFIKSVIHDELRLRNMKVPQISSATIGTITFETEQKLNGDDESTTHLTRLTEPLIFEQPHIYYGIQVLQKSIGLDPAGVVNGIYHFYNGYKRHVEADRLDRLFQEA